ncbi:MAG: DUF2835 domain-containing protein [Gammaproteobacteria bacterium]|nr:DUF2835 domain-containing protein [Gammaproteobacteria bacterium]
MSHSIQFSIKLSYEKYTAYYKGYAQNVLVRAFDGRNIQFPAEILKPYLTHEGINGVFIIHFDDRNKYKSLQKIS